VILAQLENYFQYIYLCLLTFKSFFSFTFQTCFHTSNPNIYCLCTVTALIDFFYSLAVFSVNMPFAIVF